MDKMTKTVDTLTNTFVALSLIFTTCGWIVLPLIFGGFNIEGIIFCVLMFFVLIPISEKVKNQTKTFESPLRRLLLKVLLGPWIVIFSILFISISLYALFTILTKDITQSSEAAKILTVALISICFFMFCIEICLYGKEEKKSELQNGKVVERIILTDLPKHSYTAVVLTLFTTLFSCCVFQSIFAMKYKLKFIPWFSEITSAISQKKFEDVFTIEPVNLNNLWSYISRLLNNDTIPAILFFVFVIMLGAIWAGKWMLSIIQDGKAVVTDIIEWIKKILGKKPKDSDHGYCVFCRVRSILVKFAPYNRSEVVLPDEKIIPDSVSTLHKKIDDMGISFDWDKFLATYIKRDFELKDKIGNILETHYACSRCFFTIYDDFIGKHENGYGITYVNIIGGRDTGKSCFVASVFSKYGEMMIASTPEYKYFNNMLNRITKEHKAPEATNVNVRSSPMLTIKDGSHYICMQDLAGEKSNIDIAVAAVKKNDVVAILVDIGNPETINQAQEVLTNIREKWVSKVVICITKIDKYTVYDCMSPVTKEKEFKNNIIKAIYNSNVSKNIRQKIMTLSDNPEKRTKRFLKKLQGNQSFMRMYKAAQRCSQNPVAIVANAGLGVGTSSDYTLQGQYESKYIEETVETFIS